MLGSLPRGCERSREDLFAEHSVWELDRDKAKRIIALSPKVSAKRKCSCSGAQRVKAVSQGAQGNHNCLCMAGRRHRLPWALSQQ